MKFYKPIATVLTLFLLAGCATRQIPKGPAYVRLTSPGKLLPERAKVPPTQKPYQVNGRTYCPIPSACGYTETGIASWYGNDFHGHRTSDGEIYNMYANTAAHKTLPMNTHLLVENLENGRKAIVRINDRGPFVKGRIIDMTLTGARKLGMLKKGTARVRLTALGEVVESRRGGRKTERFLPYQNFKTGDFFVQVGSFTNKQNADRLKNRLLQQGHKAVSRLYHTGGVTFYRVQVKAGRTLAVARRVEAQLDPRFPGAFVIAR